MTFPTLDMTFRIIQSSPSLDSWPISPRKLYTKKIQKSYRFCFWKLAKHPNWTLFGPFGPWKFTFMSISSPGSCITFLKLFTVHCYILKEAPYRTRQKPVLLNSFWEIKLLSETLIGDWRTDDRPRTTDKFRCLSDGGAKNEMLCKC